MTDPKFIQKSAVRWLVVGLFVFNFTVLALGLQFVKEYAASQAKEKAVVVANQAHTIDVYNTNRTTCALRALAEPQLASYRKAAKDKTLSASARKRNQARIKSTEDFLAAYATIPPDFDCSTLPKKAPTFGDK
jgi:hypothetical protein